MAFQLSAGVEVKEFDTTTAIAGVATTSGGHAGHFQWGPVEELVTVSDEVELVDRFFKPDSNTFVDFFTASNFLQYGRTLRLVRADASGLVNASANGTPAKVKNDSDYDQNYATGANTYGAWFARYPGEIGNSLKVSMYASPNTTGFDSWIYSRNFDGAPGTSTYVTNRGGLNDELHIVVVDEDGLFTGIANTVLERFGYVSAASDAKSDDGTSLYYKNVINNRSKYIRWGCHPDAGIGMPIGNSNTDNWGSTAVNTTFGLMGNSAYTVSLANGAIATPSTSNVTTAYDYFKNEEEVDISLLMTGSHSNTIVNSVYSNIVDFRKDLVMFVSPEQADVVDNYGSEVTDVVAHRDSLTSSSYIVMDCNWKYQFDKYNDVFRWVPLNGDVAGLCARTDLDRDAWYSPAGLNRGHIKNVYKLAWNPNKTQRDDIYRNSVNPILVMKGEGPVLWGDKTLLTRPSSFDRINVRRLFIVLERAIARAARYSLFEFNDEFTRSQFVSMVEPFLRDVQGRRGIYAFKVVCDETNNTPEVIDRNEFIGDIYIKPAKSINYITLNFVAVRTGVSFEEIVGQF